MISKTDLWQVFKEHEQETGQVIPPLMRNHFLEILQRVYKFEHPDVDCALSPNGKHYWLLPPDSFDDPFCMYCKKTQ